MVHVVWNLELFPGEAHGADDLHGFIPDHGSFMVASSHNMTPKDHTSAFSSLSSFLSTSGAIHSASRRLL